MCGRFTLIKIDEFLDDLPFLLAPDEAMPPRYNIAPTQPVIAFAGDGLKGDVFQWGLVPAWARATEAVKPMFNARSESAWDKPMFRAAVRKRRCVIPASGFYEWKRHGSTKRPMYIRLASRRPMAMAGIFEEWTPPGGSPVRTAAILTCVPNALMAEIHDRMPVILDPAGVRQWLAATEDAAPLAALMTPADPATMSAYEVSPRVNRVAEQGPGLIEPSENSGLFG